MVWLDGALVAVDAAVVSVGNHGFTVGDGLFETIKVVEGVPFAMRRHLARLRRTASGLDLVVPYDDSELLTAVHDAIAANQPDVGRVRLTVARGEGPLGSARGHSRATVVVQCGPSSHWSAAAPVIIVPWPRNERGALAGLKTTSYAENVIAWERAAAAGAEEALFANTVDNLCEGTGSNVFVVVDGQLMTPPLTAGCLAGVTRELLLETDLPIVESDVPMIALAGVEEAFLTSSTRDVQPVSSIDGRPLPACPGPCTGAAVDAFAALQRATIDP